MAISNLYILKSFSTHLCDCLGVPSRLIGDYDTASDTSVFVNHVDSGAVPCDDSETRCCRFIELRFRKLTDSHHYNDPSEGMRLSGCAMQRTTAMILTQSVRLRETFLLRQSLSRLQ